MDPDERAPGGDARPGRGRCPPCGSRPRRRTPACRGAGRPGRRSSRGSGSGAWSPYPHGSFRIGAARCRQTLKNARRAPSSPADDQDRLAGDVGGQVRPGVGDLLGPADHLPGRAEHGPALGVGDLGRRVPGVRDGAGGLRAAGSGRTGASSSASGSTWVNPPSGRCGSGGGSAGGGSRRRARDRPHPARMAASTMAPPPQSMIASRRFSSKQARGLLGRPASGTDTSSTSMSSGWTTGAGRGGGGAGGTGPVREGGPTCGAPAAGRRFRLAGRLQPADGDAGGSDLAALFEPLHVGRLRRRGVADGGRVPQEELKRLGRLLRRRVSVGGVLGEHPVHHVLQAVRDVRRGSRTGPAAARSRAA